MNVSAVSAARGMCSPRSKPRRRYIHLRHGKIAISLIIPPLSSTLKVKVLPLNPISLSLPPSAVVLLCFHPSERHRPHSFCNIPPQNPLFILCLHSGSLSPMHSVSYSRVSPRSSLIFIAPSLSHSHVQTQTHPFFWGGG